MSEATPRALLMDLGKVLVDYNWPATLAALAEMFPDCRDTDFENWAAEADGTVDAYCTGRLGTAAFLTAVHERFDPDRSVDDGNLMHRWCDMFVAIPGAFELVDTLATRVRLVLVSNTNPLHFAWLDAQHQLRRRFSEIVLSYEVGCLKPAASIYEAALDAARVPAAEAFFVDDLPENVAAARALGIDGYVFEGTEPLRATLGNLGLPLA